MGIMGRGGCGAGVAEEAAKDVGEEIREQSAARSEEGGPMLEFGPRQTPAG